MIKSIEQQQADLDAEWSAQYQATLRAQALQFVLDNTDLESAEDTVAKAKVFYAWLAGEEVPSTCTGSWDTCEVHNPKEKQRG